MLLKTSEILKHSLRNKFSFFTKESIISYNLFEHISEGGQCNCNKSILSVFKFFKDLSTKVSIVFKLYPSGRYGLSLCPTLVAIYIFSELTFSSYLKIFHFFHHHIHQKCQKNLFLYLKIYEVLFSLIVLNIIPVAS